MDKKEEKDTTLERVQPENGEPAVSAEHVADEKPKTKEQDRVAEMREQMLRLAAEFDNYKKRTRKDIDAAEAVGKASFAKDMLNVVDEFELALMAASRSSDKELFRGMEMVYSNLMSALKKRGLKEIDVNGAADPFRHEVVMAVASDRPEGNIIEVVKKGYEFNGMLLRPASVIVAKGKDDDKNKK